MLLRSIESPLKILALRYLRKRNTQVAAEQNLKLFSVPNLKTWKLRCQFNFFFGRYSVVCLQKKPVLKVSEEIYGYTEASTKFLIFIMCHEIFDRNFKKGLKERKKGIKIPQTMG